MPDLRPRGLRAQAQHLKTAATARFHLIRAVRWSVSEPEQAIASASIDNETRSLSLMSARRVKSGTDPGRTEEISGYGSTQKEAASRPPRFGSGSGYWQICRKPSSPLNVVPGWQTIPLL
jgi:hypothetical protein